MEPADTHPIQTPMDLYMRALCIGSCSVRGRMELMVNQLKGNKEVLALQEKLRNELIQWMKANNFEKYLSKKEKDLIRRPWGKISQQELVNLSWRDESLAVILWSIQKMDRIPPYDQEGDHELAAKTIKIMGEVEKDVQKIAVRRQDEIRRQRDIAEGWHWRSRTHQLMKSKAKVSLPAGLTFEKIIEMSAQEHHKLGEIPAPIGNDFPAFGKPYQALTDDEYGLAASIAAERHYALNWICGYSKDWDNVPTDT